MKKDEEADTRLHPNIECKPLQWTLSKVKHLSCY